MNTKDEQHVTNILETLIADEAAKNMQKSMGLNPELLQNSSVLL